MATGGGGRHRPTVSARSSPGDSQKPDNPNSKTPPSSCVLYPAFVLSLVTLACVSPDDEPIAIDLRESSAGTVFELRTEAPVTVRIEGHGGLREVATEPAGDGYLATLVLPADDVYAVHAVDEAGRSSETLELATPAAPDSLASLEQRGDPGRGGFTLLTQLKPGAAAVAVVDGAGDYLWWDHYEGEQAFAYDARPRLDGSGIDWLLGDMQTGHSVLRSLSWTGELLELDTDAAHHAFVPLPEGGWASLVEETRLVEGEERTASALVEIGPDGVQTELWNAWDSLAYDEAHTMDTGNQLWWTHANGLAYDAERETFAMSLLARASVALVDRDGALLAELGGPGCATEGATGVLRPHGPSLVGDQLLLFDNGSGDGGEHIPSRAVATRFDLAGDGWEETASFGEDLDLSVPSFGNADPTAEGWLVGWGQGGRVDRVVDGEAVWGLDAALGDPFAYVRDLARVGSMTP